MARATRHPRQEGVWGTGLCWPRAGPWTRSRPVWACSWWRTQMAEMELGPFPGQLRMLSSQITRPGRKSLIRKPMCVSPACLSRPLQSASPKTTRHRGLWPQSGETGRVQGHPVSGWVLGGWLWRGGGGGLGWGPLPFLSFSSPQGSRRPGLQSEAMEGLCTSCQFPPIDTLGPCPQVCLTPSILP